MNNYQRTMQLVTVAQNSAGEASRQFQTHLTGLEASMVRLTAAKEDFMMRLVDANAYKSVIDFMRMLLDTFSAMHPALVLLITGLTLYSAKMILSAAAASVKNQATVRSTIETFKYNAALAIGTTNEYTFAKGVAYSTARLREKAQVLGASMIAMAPYMIALGAIVGLVYALGYATSVTKREIEDMKENIGTLQEQATVKERQIDVLKNLVAEQEELRNKMTLTRQESIRLKEINDELLASYSHLKWRFDELGNVVFPNLNEHIKEQTEKTKELRLEVLELESSLATLELGEIWDDLTEELGIHEDNLLDLLGKIYSLFVGYNLDLTIWSWMRVLTGDGQFYLQELFDTFDQEAKMQDIKKELRIKEFEKAKKEAIEALSLRQSEQAIIQKGYEGIGKLAARSFAENFIANAISPEELAGMSPEEFTEFATEMQYLLMQAFDRFDLDEIIFQNIVDNFNERFRNSLTSETSVQELQDILNEYFKIFEDLELDSSLAFNLITDEDVYQIAQAFNNLQHEANLVVSELNSLDVHVFIELMQYIENMGWNLQNNREDIAAVIQEFDKLSQITAQDTDVPLFDKIKELQDNYLKQGFTHAFNSELQQLREEFNLTSDQVERLVELFGVFAEQTTDEAFFTFIESLKNYKDNMIELNEVKEKLINNQAIELDQMLALAEAYNLQMSDFEIIEGQIQLRVESLEKMIELEDIRISKFEMQARAAIEAEKAELQARLEGLKARAKNIRADLALAEEAGNAKIQMKKEEEEYKDQIQRDALENASENENKAGEDLANINNEKLEVWDTYYDTIEIGHIDIIERISNAWNSFKSWIETNIINPLAESLASLEGVSWEGKSLSQMPTYTPSGIFEAGQALNQGAGLKLSSKGGTSSANLQWTSALKLELQALELEIQEITANIEALDNLLANLHTLDIGSYLDGISGSGGSLKDAIEGNEDLTDSIEDLKEALDDMAEQIEEYISKLDMWYNATRQILIINEQLTKLLKKRELTHNVDLINTSLEAELILLRQLEAQHKQLYQMQFDEKTKIAIALQTAAGAAVTLSDDLQHLHVNQAAYQALSMGHKEIVDELIESFDELSKSIHASETAALDAAIAIQGIQLEMANRYINAIQSGLQKQQKILIAAIDNELKAIQESHEQKIKMYDEELNKINDIIDAKIKAIDLEKAQEDWQKQLEEAKEDELKIRAEINKLALDDSFEANARRMSLEEELSDKVKSIEQMQRDRQRELRKQQLQDLKEHYRQQYEETQKANNNELQALQEKLNETKDRINYHYQEIFNDEKYWAQMRLDILEGNFDEVERQVANLNHFFDDIGQGLRDLALEWGIELSTINDDFNDNIEENMFQLRTSWNATRNIMQEITNAQQQAISVTQALSTEIAAMTADVLRHTAAIQAAQAAANMGSQSSTGGTGSSHQHTHMYLPGDAPSPSAADHGHMSPAWRAGYQGGMQAIAMWRSNGSPPYPGPWTYQSRIRREMGYDPGGRNAGGFGDRTWHDWNDGFAAAMRDHYRNVPQQPTTTITPDTGSTVPWWQPQFGGGGGISAWHDGGIVSSGRQQYHSSYSKIASGTQNRISKLINEMFQTKNNEVIAKLLEGEVVVNPVANIDNLRNNLQSFVSQIQGASTIIPSSTQYNSETVHVHVNNMVADNKQHVQDVFDAISRGKRRVGKNS